MKIIIIGGIGTAIVLADQIFDSHERFGMDVEVLGLALDDKTMGDSISGYPILCGINELYDKYKNQDDVKFIYSLYRSDQIRERTKILYDLNIPAEKFCNFIHPTAYIARSAKIGYGNVFLANVIVNSNTSIGNFNTINSGTLIGHDMEIGDNNFFAAQITVGSMLTIGNMNFFGLNSAIKTGITIGDGNLIGQFSNVIKNIEEDQVVFGNPAQSHGEIKKKENKNF